MDQQKKRRRRRAPTFDDLAARRPLQQRAADLPLYTRKAAERSEVPRIFRVDDSEAAGLSRGQAVTGENMAAPRHGVRMSPRAPEVVVHPGWADSRWFAVRARLAAVQALRPDAVGSHTTAAELLGIPLPPHRRGRDAPVHVLSPVTNGVQAAGVDGHRGALAEPPREVGGVAVTGYRQTLAQLAPMLSERDLVIAIEALIGPWRSAPVSVEHIERHLAENTGRRGARKLRRALVRSRAGVGSPRESAVRLDLIDWGLPEPDVGRKVWVADLQRHLTPDLLYEEIRTAIEYEGDHHRTDRRQMEVDIERANAFRSAGYFLERLTRNTPLVGLLVVLAERFEALRAGTLRFPSAY